MRERSSKRGILVFEIKEDLLNIFIYAYMDGLKRWVLGPQGYIISVGNPMSHHPDVVNYGTEAARLVPGRGELPEARLRENIWLFPIHEPSYDTERCMADDLRELSALNCVLMLLNCKNVMTEKHEPPIALNKKRTKKGKPPLFTYHTLVLQPLGKKQESIPQDLWNNRIHLQRGHFKTYTDDKPLFGHIVGRFWWQPHVRGKSKEGMIVKDYVMKT
jgi:hypothetical protein